MVLTMSIEVISESHLSRQGPGRIKSMILLGLSWTTPSVLYLEAAAENQDKHKSLAVPRNLWGVNIFSGLQAEFKLHLLTLSKFQKILNS